MSRRLRALRMGNVLREWVRAFVADPEQGFRLRPRSR